ncbi:biosynthetic arginine decarboxylase [Glaciecola sp. 1036]|uniref:biosynthetic arginine decarboxylase n=1 Tax=Alteromonadaceae TaxID=72275 RepID=UPI003D043E77
MSEKQQDISPDWTIEDAERTYGVSSWGGGYFQIGENGNVQVVPQPSTPDVKIDFGAVIEEIQQENIQFPLVIRFHDILRSQVVTLNETFRQVIKEYKYNGEYRGVYPIKVNQMREVVEEIVDAGEPYNFGLEAGSKPELLAVLAYNTNPEALTILNGYKDEEFMRLALLGRRLGRKIVVVIEKYSELVLLVKLSKQLGISPIVGLRAKMQVKSMGRWQGSAGERAKFGLTMAEIIKAARYLEQHDMSDTLQLLHFHIGSQLPDIWAIKEAVSESARIYADLVKMGFPLSYVDVGGGLGIDYDGTKSTSDSSRNYSLQEYVADVVYGLREMCDLEGVPHPNIVSESGRAITAHHSMVVTEVVGEITPDGADIDTTPKEGDHFLLKNLYYLHTHLAEQKNMQEVFNDATQYKEQASHAFKLRVISLEELAKIETLYWKIMRQVNNYYKGADFVPAEVQTLDFSLSSQYLCNFSIFQSAVDSWAIDQILPVVPLTGLQNAPVKNCSLVDITCDSDGKIDKFIIEYENSQVLPMHQIDKDKPLYLGLFLTGAYQDVMGDMHNLFGRLNEVHIFSHDDDPEDFYIEEIIKGSTIEQVLSVMQYHPKSMAIDVKRLIDKEVSEGKIKPREGVKWTDFYEECLAGYTYLRTKK